MSKRHYMLILLALGLLTRFMFFGHPNETVFDEVHFGKFISGYYTREYFFDIHPPLGKLLIAGFAKLFSFKPEFAFAEIGDAYPDKQYLILRFLPALAGALLPLVIFLLAMELGLAPLYAFLAGILIVFENALLTQSIYILMDAFLLLFGFLSLLFYFKYHNSKSHRYFYLFAISSGLAISIKWTGLGFLGLPLIFEFFSLIKNHNYKKIFGLIYPVIVAFLIYFLFFALHLNILNKSGPGDAFMTPGFQKTLEGNNVPESDTSEKSNIFQKFTQLNAEMYKANQRLDAEHPYSSPWYSWPFMTRSIYYWVKDESRIYLLGNPAIWWASTVAIIFIILSLMYNYRLLQDRITLFLISGFIINLLPFVGVKRVMFLYHYFTALIFAILMFAYLIDKRKISWKIISIYIVIVAILFTYFAPLSYGLRLSPKFYENHVWFESWR